jgi:hypothetical protein
MNSTKSLIAGSLVLAGLALPAFAADNIVIKFNNSTESTFIRWWGGALQTYEHDTSMDADGDASSGSQRIAVAYDLAAYGGDNQFAAQLNLPATIDGRDYTNLVFDIRFDPTSNTRSSGDYGYLEFGLGPTDFSQIQLGATTVPVGSSWVRVTARIDPTTPKLESIARVWVKIWSGGTDGFTGPTILWIDNLTLNANTDVAPPPPPTLALRKATPGLQLVASHPTEQYQRQSIFTAGNTYSWYGNFDPVTYAITIGEYPDRSHSGFQTHIFLLPGTGFTSGEPSVDYNRANLIFLDIGNSADGGGYASFRYKTNLPSGNSMVYNSNPDAGPVGTLASIGSPQVTGTWSLRFNSDTAITLTTPSGSETNFSLPDEAAALFAGPLHAYFGVQPNQPGNIGQGAVLSRIQITGLSTPLDETFPGPTLDAATWLVAATHPAGIILAPPDTAWALSWTLPDTGFGVELIYPDLDTGIWYSPGLTGTQLGSRKVAFVPTSLFPALGPNQGAFFRMTKP